MLLLLSSPILRWMPRHVAPGDAELFPKPCVSPWGFYGHASNFMRGGSGFQFQSPKHLNDVTAVLDSKQSMQFSTDFGLEE